MITFSSYLKKNKGRAPSKKRPKSFMPGWYGGVNYNDNQQAVASMDVTGDPGTFDGGGEEEELSLLAQLQNHTQAEEEEDTLEWKDPPGTDNDTGSSELPDKEDDVDSDPDQDTEQNKDTPTDSNDDPDKQGLIRTIPNAHLVYKRQGEDSTYEELWMYEIKKGMRDEYDIRNDILAGTDIPPKGTKSPDGSQSYDMWTAGDMQLLQIVGLPN